VKHAVALALVLFGLWLALSGMMEAHLIALGVLSCALVVWIARRMDALDTEGQPLHLGPWRCVVYAFWLLVQIAKANLDVARRILSPGPRIGPRCIRVPSTQHSAMTRTIYANSITLTPGTVSIDVDEEGIAVHALTRAGAEELMRGEMDARVTRLEAPE